MCASEYKHAFEDYLYEHNTEGSGKASSYLKGLQWLQAMLRLEDFGLEGTHDIWSIRSVEQLTNLRKRTLEEQKKGPSSPWVNGHIAKSYLRDNWCSGALAHLIEFMPQYLHSQKVMDLIKQHEGDDSELAAKLNFEPSIPKGYVHNPTSQDGKERIAEAKVRIGQSAFRKMILYNYSNRCCITGLDVPTVNRASHIIGWADPKGKKIRMDPRNGLCLSATYDAAFDKHLISLDPDYRIILSKEIKEHYSSESVQTYFKQIEGTAIELPSRFRPKQDYLEVHRKNGSF